jgi:hypothetical protein
MTYHLTCGKFSLEPKKEKCHHGTEKCHHDTSEVPPWHLGSATMAPEYTIEETSEESIESLVSYSLTEPKTGETNMKSNFQGVSAKDVMGIVKSKPVAPKTILARLRHIWVTDLPLIFNTIKFVPQLPPKELGMLSLFVKRLEMQPVEKIFKQLLSEWPEYCAYVRGVTGTKSSPEFPNIPYLLKYCGEAVNYVYATHKKPVTLVSEPLIKHKKSPPLPEIVLADEDKPMTLAELIALEQEWV